MTKLDPAIASRLKRDANGLFSAVVQEHGTGQVLMVAWMDDDALARTLETREATYFSRSRGEQWINFSPGPNVAKLRWSEMLDVHQDFAYGAGSKSLRWRYGAFALGQANGQVAHAVSVSAPPARPETKVDRAAVEHPA